MQPITQNWYFIALVEIFVSCSAAEQACSFPHYSLHKKCIFFPCLTATSLPTQPLSLRIFPKLICKLFFHAANSKKHFQHDTWPDHCKYTSQWRKSSNLSADIEQLTAAVLLVYHDAKWSKLTVVLICTAAGWGCPCSWLLHLSRGSNNFHKRFCFIRLSSAALLGLCSQSSFQPHLSVQQKSLNICRVSSVTN